jgi:hypothetical protein
MKQSEMIAAALSEYRPDQIHGDSLRILVPGDEFLQDTVDQFLRIRGNQYPAPVACFYETRSSNVGAIVGHSQKRVSEVSEHVNVCNGWQVEANQLQQEFIVNEASGTLNQSDSIKKYPLERTHFNINKFGKDSPSYRLVSKVIQDMARSASELLLARSQCK